LVFAPYDIIIDGTDNFPTRYLTNDACVLLGKPNVYGSIFRFEGQASVFYAKEGPCYRCLFPEPPPPGLVPSCAEGGVLGVLPGTVGAIQATEAIKLILGVGEPLIGRLLLYDATTMSFDEVRLRKNPDCPICGEHPTITELIDYEQFCAPPTTTRVRRAGNGGVPSITPIELQRRLDAGDDLFILDVREPPVGDQQSAKRGRSAHPERPNSGASERVGCGARWSCNTNPGSAPTSSGIATPLKLLNLEGD
jgi:adenylyltransferase/sulfurtransferase